MDIANTLEKVTRSHTTPLTAEEMVKAFSDFIVEQGHPCVMAQSVFRQEQVNLHVYEQLGTAASAGHLMADLKAFLHNQNPTSKGYFSFIAVFRSEPPSTEEKFEGLLWKQLQLLHDIDDHRWDPTVSSDPDDHRFSYSLAGHAFYVVGMHPNSSRLARQSPYPALVFNLHSQFEDLREADAYTNIKEKIREQDRALQGNHNPMLDDFGNSSEARQYSGRQVGEDWICPFSPKKGH